jgi:hypothetical protein
VFAIIAGLIPELSFLEFGDSIEPRPEILPHLRWVVDDYGKRRDEQWRHPALDGSEAIEEIIGEYVGDAERLGACILAIGWYGLPEKSWVVHQFEDHPSLLVRRAVLIAVRQLGSFTSLKLVSRRIEDPNPLIHQPAIVAAGAFGLRLEQLEQRVDDPVLGPIAREALARIAAGQKLAKDDATLPLVVDVLGSAQYEDFVGWTVWVYTDMTAVLLEKENDMTKRLHAARVLGLGRQPVPIVIECLGGIVNDAAEPLPLRVESAIALGRLGRVAQTPQIYDLLLPALDVPEPELQDEVITAIGRSRKVRALEVLLGHWDDRTGAARDRVSRACRSLAAWDGYLLMVHAWLWFREMRDVRPGELTIYLFRPTDPSNPIEWEWRRGYAEDWVLPQLDRPEAAARRDALLLLALAGRSSDLPRIERVFNEDVAEENRWLAAAVHIRIRRGTTP